MGRDRRGKKRSYCMTIPCDCNDYEMPRPNGGNDCDYCGCKPTKHALVIDDDDSDDDKTDPKQGAVTANPDVESPMNPSKKVKTGLDDDMKGLEPKNCSKELGRDVDDADDAVVLVDNDEESSGPCEGEWSFKGSLPPSKNKNKLDKDLYCTLHMFVLIRFIQRNQKAIGTQ